MPKPSKQTRNLSDRSRLPHLVASLLTLPTAPPVPAKKTKHANAGTSSTGCWPILGKFDEEFRSLAGLRFKCDLSAMRGDHILHDRQAEAGSAVCRG